MAEKCVHQGCGKLFTDANEECKYHPGPPIFHEGQKDSRRVADLQALRATPKLIVSKGWKCCKPRVLTFDEFMTIPPCTIGVHSTTDKPPE
ncbi:hypothetical protein LLEC1_07952, partial [Akanthomyces lecanii]